MVENKVSFGLVLGGGGARGLAHVGAIKALNHLGYFPSVIAGVSMGAVVAATYALNDNWYKQLVDMDISGFPAVPDFKAPGLKSKLKALLIAEREIRDTYFGWGAGQRTVTWGRAVLEGLTLGKNLEDSRISVYVAATDVLTGERVVMTRGNAVDAVYASSALAGVLPPFPDGDRLLIDGGYTDIAPVDVVRRSGVDFVISINPANLPNDEKPRNGFEVFLRSIEVTHNVHSNMRFDEADLILRPEFRRPIGILEFHQKRDCIAAGARAVLQAATKIRDVLESTPHRSDDCTDKFVCRADSIPVQYRCCKPTALLRGDTTR